MILRIFDILISSLALLVLLPLMLPIVIILKFTGEGEVFFSQERVGKQGQTFRLYKFATMVKNSPNIGTGTITMRDDPRILPVGKFLRKTKINELPQLFNIVIGDMSVIGPRPLTQNTFNSYSPDIQKIIKQLRPGLSGIGSIIFRGEEEIMHGANASVDFYESSIAPYKGELEEWFFANKSIKIYFLAIFVTIWIILFPKTKVIWQVFDQIPAPPENLKAVLRYRD